MRELQGQFSLADYRCLQIMDSAFRNSHHAEYNPNLQQVDHWLHDIGTSMNALRWFLPELEEETSD